MTSRISTRLRAPRAAVLAFACAALAACSDRSQPVAPPVPEPPAVTPARISCTATVQTLRVTCGPSLPGGARGVFIGGQHEYVEVTNTAPTYNAGTTDFTFDVTLTNLTPQPWGTTDGTTPTAEGVRIFFDQPVAANGGSVTVDNETGTTFFTRADQEYYQYSGTELGADGILSQNEASSAKTWIFKVAPTVTSFTFQMYVSTAVPFPDGYVDVSPAADTMTAGGTQQLAATVRDYVGGEIAGQTVAWGTSDGAVATVSASGLVTAVGPGTATITATSGARSGSATVAVCPSVAPGGVQVFDMPAGASFCLGGAAEYTVVPLNAHDAASVSLAVTGAGIVPVSGPPSPNRLPGAGPRFGAAAGPQPDYGFESRLRQMERGIPRGGAGGAAPAGPRFAITPGVPAVGDLMTLNVETDNACSTNDLRTGRVKAVGTRVIVIADTLNPAGLSDAQYAAVADSFDNTIWPVVTGAFGTPADIDGNGRVVAFYTRAVNELTPPGSSSFIGGFFFSRDLRTAASCPTSNVGEMFYMLAADPAGAVNGNARSVAFVLDKTLGTLAHEFEHLINASRRMYVNTPWNGLLEEVWMDEGLAHVAEELMFYQAAGLAPGQDLDIADLPAGVVQDAFFKYAESNFGRLRQWLLSPTTSGPFEEDDDLSTRGSSWSFLRYAADRKGGTQATFWSALVNTQETGLANLQAALGTAPEPWYRDWAAAMYADNATTGVAAQFSQPSWNFRSIYASLDYTPGPGCSCAYELAVRDPTNGVTDNFTLAEGGASAYLRMGVSTGGFAGVTVRSGGVAPPATVRVAVFRRE